MAIGGYYVGAMGLCLFNNESFLLYFLTLTPFEKCFGELPATLVSEFGCVRCHVGIYFKRVEFELYYIYKTHTHLIQMQLA